MKPYESEQIAAFINADMVNSVFVIFEKHGDHYDEVYSKDLFVESVKIIGGTENNQKLILTAGTSGTGYVESYHFVIRFTPEGYKDVWKGIARYFVSNYIAPHNIQYNGTVGFDAGGDELYYSLIKSQPRHDVTAQLYKYNNQKMNYELIKSYN